MSILASIGGVDLALLYLLTCFHAESLDWNEGSLRRLFLFASTAKTSSAVNYSTTFFQMA